MSLNNLGLFRGSLGTVVFALAALATGCGPSPKPKAAQSLGCGKDKIELEGGGAYDTTAIATGCGKKDVLYRDNGKWASLRERAAFEMSCGAGELEIAVLESDVFGATGCGHRIVYKHTNVVGMVVQTTSDVAPAPAIQGAAPAPAPAPAPVAAEPDVTAEDIAPTPAPSASAKSKSKK